jgi:hypothetical protein
MNIRCLRAVVNTIEGITEIVADFELTDFGLILRNMRLLSDGKVAGPVLPPNLEFASFWDRSIFLAVAYKAVAEFQATTRKVD